MQKNRNKKGQMIVIMGFLLVILTLVLTSMAVNLSSVGYDVPMSYSKAIVPEMVNVKEKFKQALNYYYLIYDSTKGDIELSFDETYKNIYTIELSKGNYFEAELNSFTYAGSTYTSTIMKADVYLSLDDGFNTISRNTDILIFESL